ncbi:MAG: PIN domain-containing protein, partial [Polyangiales bacterium]
FEKHAESIVTASIVLHEMWFGIERLPRSRRRDHLERFMRDVVGAVRVFPYGERAARWHATERVRLAAKGHTAPFADGQIAAIAAVHEAILVTANRRDFEGFAGLKVESWGA